MKNRHSEILSFNTVEGKTAYNPPMPFFEGGIRYMAVRVESLESELDSKIVFARETEDNKWIIDYSVPSLGLQDPTYQKIRGEIVLSGVRVQKEEKEAGWHQEFYRGDSIRTLNHFTSGPKGMKDIRLVDLDEKIGVFTRPNGKIGGLGKIGYLEVNSVDELEGLTENDWYGADMIGGLFDDESWGGVNQAVKLSDGMIGVIGHKAHKTFPEGVLQKHYHAISFRYDPRTNVQSHLKNIAKRDDFPTSISKRSPELDNVIFPAGVDEEFNLYCGLSDYCIGVRKIENPF
ncbi:MAG: DUF1861 family protein [Nanoarchaeota archaeon]